MSPEAERETATGGAATLPAGSRCECCGALSTQLIVYPEHHHREVAVDNLTGLERMWSQLGEQAPAPGLGCRNSHRGDKEQTQRLPKLFQIPLVGPVHLPC